MSFNTLDIVFAQEMIKPVKLPRYRESVYNTVKEAILDGQLTSGQPLIEEQLAASLHVSRTPIREALAILEYEGFIGPHGNRGLYVCTVTPTEFVDLFVANEVVEPQVMRRAALAATPAQLDNIAGALRQAETCLVAHDMVGCLRAARNFHRLVGVASGNLALTNFVVKNEERTDMYLLNSGKVIDLTKLAASHQEHEAIFKALLRRDSEAAERLTIYHAQSLRARFAELFTEEMVA